MVYSDSFKEHMVEKMLDPNGLPAAALAAESGVSVTSLWRWRKNAVDGVDMSPKNASKHSARRRKRSPKQKIRIVMEAAKLTDDELGGFLRQEGLHEADLERLRDEVMQAAEAGLSAPKKTGDSAVERENKSLKKELARKEKALAETAAILVLRGKLEAFLLEEEEGDTKDKKGR